MTLTCPNCGTVYHCTVPNCIVCHIEPRKPLSNEINRGVRDEADDYEWGADCTPNGEPRGNSN